MNKAELIANMAEKSGLTKKDTEKAVNSFMEFGKRSVIKGRKGTVGRLWNL